MQPPHNTTLVTSILRHPHLTNAHTRGTHIHIVNTLLHILQITHPRLLCQLVQQIRHKQLQQMRAATTAMVVVQRRVLLALSTWPTVATRDWAARNMDRHRH
jgi:hypothetical protein